MKNFISRLLVFAFFMLFSAPILFAQDGSGELPEPASAFATFTALVAVIPIVTEFLKKLLGKTSVTPDWAVQALSWIVGLVISLFGYFFNLGFLAEATWYMALLYGFGASLAANGIADTKIIEWIFSLFKKKEVH